MNARGHVGRALLMAGLLTLTSVPAFTAGIELAWNHCYGQAGAQNMRTSACTTNTGSQTMIASFRPPDGVTALEGIHVYIDYSVLGGQLGCWWNFATGQVRSVDLTPLPVSPTDANGTPLILCDNHYFLNRGATGGVWMTVMGPDYGRLQGVVSIQAGSGGPVLPDAQQYGVGFRITNGNTVPTASCPGCLQAACFVLKLIRLYSPGKPDVLLESPHPGSSNWVTWQGSDQATGCPGPHGNYEPIPVLRNTWGAIKGIYR